MKRASFGATRGRVGRLLPLSLRREGYFSEEQILHRIGRGFRLSNHDLDFFSFFSFARDSWGFLRGVRGVAFNIKRE